MLVKNLPFEVRNIITSRIYWYYRKKGLSDIEASKKHNECLLYSIKQVSIIIPIPKEAIQYL